jgi:hypothetical protein
VLTLIDANDEQGTSADFGAQAAAVLEDAISVIPASDTEILPYSSSSITLAFTPDAVGTARVQLEISFPDQPTPPILLSVSAECTDLPVQLEQTVANYRTCQLGRSYLEHVVVCNNSSSAVNVQFELYKECQPYFKFSPRNAFLPSKVASLTLSDSHSCQAEDIQICHYFHSHSEVYGGLRRVCSG